MRKESLIFYLTYHTRKPNTGATLMTAKLLTKAKRFSFSLLRIPLRQDYGAIESIGVAPGYKFITYDYSKAMYFGRKLSLRGSFDRHPHPLFTISNFNFDPD